MTCPKCLRQYDAGARLCAFDGTPLVDDGEDAGDHHLAPGTVVGDYEIVRLLGEGGMGEVYLARQPIIGREVAIKVLKSVTQGAVGRFIREARAATRLRRRNVVDIFTFGRLSDGRPYFVMEYLQGLSLEQYIRSRSRIPLAESVPILRAIASTLDAAHGEQMVHRDLKPANVFLEHEENGSFQVKLLDFGLVKVLQSQESEIDKQTTAVQTKAGAILGTPRFMAPECFGGADPDYRRADLYSLGVVAYQMLTGTYPHEGRALADLVANLLLVPPRPPSSHGLAAGIDGPLLKMLHRDPFQRYPNATAFVEALAAVEGISPPDHSIHVHLHVAPEPHPTAGTAPPSRWAEQTTPVLAGEPPVLSSVKLSPTEAWRRDALSRSADWSGSPIQRGESHDGLGSTLAEANPSAALLSRSSLEPPRGGAVLTVGAQVAGGGLATSEPIVHEEVLPSAPPVLETSKGAGEEAGDPPPPRSLDLSIAPATVGDPDPGFGVAQPLGADHSMELPPPPATPSVGKVAVLSLILVGLIALAVNATRPAPPAEGQAPALASAVQAPPREQAPPTLAPATPAPATPAPATPAPATPAPLPSTTAGSPPASAPAAAASRAPSAPRAPSATASAPAPSGAARLGTPPASASGQARPAQTELWGEGGERTAAVPRGPTQLGKMVVGQPLPRVAGLTLGAEAVSLDQLRKAPGTQAVLVQFWASWCSPCVGEMKQLTRGRARLESAGVKVLLVNLLEDPQTVTEALGAYGGGFTNILDANGVVLERMGLKSDGSKAVSLPVSVLVDPSGKVIAIFNQGTNGYVDHVLSAL